MPILRSTPFIAGLILLSACASDPNKGYIERTNARIQQHYHSQELEPYLPMIREVYADRPALLNISHSSNDAPPVLVRHYAGDFPNGYQITKGEYKIMMAFVIGKDGRVVEPRPLGDYNRDFVQNAKRALRKWLFKPASRNGQPIEVWAVVPFVFAMR